MTPYSSESASVVSGTAPSASKRVPRCTRSVASPPSSSSMFGPTTSPFSSRNSKRRCVHHQYSGRVSPFHADTGTPAGCSGVPSPTTIAAAAWSCVEKMLQLTQRTSAPSAVSVSMRTAVCTVMCREPAMRAPERGCASPYSARSAIRPGISCSASWISLRPKGARERSATLKSPSVSTRVSVLAVMSLQGAARRLRAMRMRSAQDGGLSAVAGNERACRGFGGARTAVQGTAWPLQGPAASVRAVGRRCPCSGQVRGGAVEDSGTGCGDLRAGRHEGGRTLAEGQRVLGGGQLGLALGAQQDLGAPAGEDAGLRVELDAGEVEIRDRPRVVQAAGAEHRVEDPNPAVGEFEHLDEGGQV